MRNLVLLILCLGCLCSKTFSDELRDKNGLPIILSVGDALNEKPKNLIGWSASVKGFVYYQKTDEVAYLFKDISSLVTFKSENALIVEVPDSLQAQFEKRHLCNVVLRGTFNRNGLSETNVLLQKVTHLTLSEVFALHLSEKEESEDYTCFVQKVIKEPT
jgi:hypothetical protein